MTVKFLVSTILLSLFVFTFGEELCPYSFEEFCAVSCIDKCHEEPTECEGRNGAIGKVYPRRCNCCKTCVYSVGKGARCGFDDATNSSYECNCNHLCQEGICIPYAKSEMGRAWVSP